MSLADTWLLPDGMDEVLPPQARKIENLRRQLLDLFHRWGYDLVLPPKVEFLESLLTGAGHDLDLQTFKVMDQLTGRMMGFSADVTPQVARMDAHSMHQQGITRFCYSSEIVRTHVTNPLGSRSPIQIGAEMFGHAGLHSDLEILSLMTDSLLLAGAQQLCLDLGHVKIYRELLRVAALPDETRAALFDLLQHKRLDELSALLSPWQHHPAVGWLQALAHLNGGPEVLLQARQVLTQAPEPVLQAIQDLEALVAALTEQYPQVQIYLDLSELRGFHYHTGLVFAAYVPQLGQALAQGGRYDDIGQAFGRARAATGFSMDLKVLASLQRTLPDTQPIYAPTAILADPAGRQQVQKWRQQGERVILTLPNEEMTSSRQLVQQEGEWVLQSF